MAQKQTFDLSAGVEESPPKGKAQAPIDLSAGLEEVPPTPPGASIRGVGKLEHYGNLAAEALPDVGGAMGALVGGTLGEGIFPFGGGLGGALAGSQIGGSLGRGAEGSLKRVVARMAGVPPPPEPSTLGGVLDVAGAGAKQQYQTLAAEGVGRGVKGGMEALFPKANIPAGRVAGEKVTGKAVGKLAEERGVISGPEAAKKTALQRLSDYSIFGNRIAAQAKQQGTEAASRYADELAAKIAPSTDPRTSGLQIRTALEQARTNFRQLGKQYWEQELPRHGATITVDMMPLVKDAESASAEIPETLLTSRASGPIGATSKSVGSGDLTIADLPPAIQQALQAAGQGGAALPQESGATQLVKNMRALKPQMTANDALQVKKYLNRFMPEGPPGSFASTETEGLAKRFEGKLYDQIDQAAQQQGGPFADTWKQARNFWGKGHDTFDSKLVTNILDKDPEGYVKMIHDGDVTDINQVKKALFGQVERTDQPQLRGQAQKAWDTFRRQYIQSRLLQDPEDIQAGKVIDLKKRMNQAGPEQLTAIFNTDAKGREVLGNLRTLAEAMSRQVKETPMGRRQVTRAGEAFGIMHGILTGNPLSAGTLAPVAFETLMPGLAWVLYSKRYTRQLVHGLELSGRGIPDGASIISRVISQASGMHPADEVVRKGDELVDQGIAAAKRKYGSTPEMPQPEATQ